MVPFPFKGKKKKNHLVKTQSISDPRPKRAADPGVPVCILGTAPVPAPASALRRVPGRPGDCWSFISFLLFSPLHISANFH